MTAEVKPLCLGSVDSIMRGTLPCLRPAIREHLFLGAWRPLCRYHVASFSDLPQRTLAAMAVGGSR